MTHSDRLVCGERAADVAQALLGLEFAPEQDGMMTVNGPLGAPAARALMRCEAELLLAEADLWGSVPGSARTPGERRGDAFLLLVERMVAMLDAQDSGE